MEPHYFFYWKSFCCLDSEYNSTWIPSVKVSAILVSFVAWTILVWTNVTVTVAPWSLVCWLSLCVILHTWSILSSARFWWGVVLFLLFLWQGKTKSTSSLKTSTEVWQYGAVLARDSCHQDKWCMERCHCNSYHKSLSKIFEIHILYVISSLLVTRTTMVV